MNPNQTIPTAAKSRPIKFSGALKEFEQGVLCFVVARRYQGVGSVRLILHRAQAVGEDAFGYGADGHYVVSPGTLTGMGMSPAKQAAARANGVKGGRPKGGRK